MPRPRHNIFARAGALLAAALVFGACTAEPPPRPEPALTLDAALERALAEAGNPEDPHAQAEAVAAWMGRRYARVQSLARHDTGALLASSALDPLGAAVLFREFALRLGMRTRVAVYYDVPAYAWYPVVELLDADGDHAWDPFALRFAQDADGTPKPLAKIGEGPVRAFDAARGAFTNGDPVSPGLAALAGHPSVALKAEAAALFGTDVDFAAPRPFTYDGAAGEEAPYRRQYETLGEAASELGPVNFGHRFALRNLTPGDSYALRIEWREGRRSALVVSAEGVTVAARAPLERGVRYVFTAGEAEARVTVGGASGAGFAVGRIEWSRP